VLLNSIMSLNDIYLLEELYWYMHWYITQWNSLPDEAFILATDYE